MENKLHRPVMLQEVLNNCPSSLISCLDGNFGRGGHTKALLENFPKVRIAAWDCDKEAIEFGKNHFQSYTKEARLSLHHKRWDLGCEDLKENEFDMVLLDLGVSSPQLDEPERGFSFYKEGPLDMRMDQSQNLRAQDIVNTYGLESLIELFQSKGEVQRPQKVAHGILKRRKEKRFETTTELSEFIETLEGWRKKGFHPATQFFQALRLEVNDELEQFKKTLPFFFRSLKDKGRIITISFHSLEDRIAKKCFQELQKEKKGFKIYKNVLTPSDEEKQQNPRSRSAKMRVFQKGAKN